MKKGNLTRQEAIDKMCRVPCCEGEIRAKKKRLCNKHYLRWSRYRTLHPQRRPKGTGTIKREGYTATCVDGSLQYDHIRICEEILGKELPKKAQVHHIDGDRSNNSNSNLVICEDAEYHLLLHRRERALDACGNPNHRKCQCCSEYDDPGNMNKFKSGAKNGFRYQHRQQGYRCVNQDSSTLRNAV